MSDILKMLEMFGVNHEFAPAAQRDLDEIINALRATPAPVAQPSATHTAACELLSALEEMIHLAGNAPWSREGKDAYESAKAVVEKYRPLAAAQAQEGK